MTVKHDCRAAPRPPHPPPGQRHGGLGHDSQARRRWPAPSAPSGRPVSSVPPLAFWPCPSALERRKPHSERQSPHARTCEAANRRAVGSGLLQRFYSLFEPVDAAEQDGADGKRDGDADGEQDHGHEQGRQQRVSPPWLRRNPGGRARMRKLHAGQSAEGSPARSREAIGERQEQGRAWRKGPPPVKEIGGNGPCGMVRRQVEGVGLSEAPESQYTGRSAARPARGPRAPAARRGSLRPKPAQAAPGRRRSAPGRPRWYPRTTRRQ